MWESVLKTLGLDALKAGLRKAGKQISKREYAELISEAVRELLKLHPDISAAEATLLAAEALAASSFASAAEAKLLAAEALALPMTAEMLSARKMLKAVKRERKSTAKKRKKKKARKKAAATSKKKAAAKKGKGKTSS
ncbi:MAG TPA: hypothetical protein VLB07_08230 [Woeseiaceae bacterium]|nr:hypothetical protein [Woeseiaceae bacterium]